MLKSMKINNKFNKTSHRKYILIILFNALYNNNSNLIKLC